MATSRSGTRRGRLLRRLLSARGRRLEITRAGWLFIVLTLGVGFAAINSGSNLLHALFGAQMALIIGSGILSERAVFRAEARRELVESIHAGTPAPVRVEIRNRSASGELLSVSVEDDDVPHADQEHTGNCRPVFAVRLSPAQTLTLHSTVTMPRRGRHRLPKAVVATRFPFGLFVKKRDLSASPIVTVYPRLHPMVPKPSTSHRPGSGEAAGRRARVGEFFGLREYREGDDPRRIYWRAMARSPRPVLREHEALGDTELMLNLPPGVTGEPQFETEVERIASMAVAHLQEPGVAVGLRYGAQVVVEPSSGSHARRNILDVLAVIGEQPA